jgi:3-phosphoshikimate 1-carboxyvinyltransferase
MPDTVPTLAVLALFAEGTTTIQNVRSLRLKETDRLSALARELRKLGAKVTELPDGLVIDAPAASFTTKHSAGAVPPRIDTYNDHRMAMSFALAGLRVPGLIINDPDCVGKTFPGFFQLFEEAASANRSADAR